MNTRQTVLLLLLCCALASALPVQGASTKPSIHQVPATVQKAIQAQLAGDNLSEIERDDEDGEISYTVTFTRDGKERDFTVGEDGTLMSQEVMLDEAPPAVQRTIKAQVGQGTLDDIQKTVEETEINYEVDMTRKDGQERSFTVGLDGKLISLQVSLEEAPAVVRKTVEKILDQDKPGDIYRMFENGRISYEVEASRDGKKRDFNVAENGKLNRLQAVLSDTPEAVQKTITDKVGAGKFVRIDKSFEATNGALTYEVEARKDGKSFNFSVGPGGRFLGMDE